MTFVNQVNHNYIIVCVPTYRWYFSLASIQVLQQRVRRRKDSDPTSKGEAFQMSHLSQETVHRTRAVNTLHAGEHRVRQNYKVGNGPARPRSWRILAHFYLQPL